MNSPRSYEKIRDGFLWSFKESEPYFFAFGVAVIVGVLGFYFVNLCLGSNDTNGIYEDFVLRCMVAFLMLPVIFHGHWPEKWKKFLPGYWYIVLTFSLPFFFSFMMLMNPLSNLWHLNGIICLFILSLFVDVVSLFILAFIGIAAGVFYFFIKSTEFFIPSELRQILLSYIGPIIYITLFSRKREKILQHKMMSMKMTAEFIAHELRTPLASMTIAAQALAKILPYYCQAYQQAKELKIPIKLLNTQQEKNIIELPKTLENVSKNANLMLSIFLVNLNQGRVQLERQTCSMAKCVQEALATYPFSTNDRKLVHFSTPKNSDEDFLFYGHFELTKHVLFNLLKNALHSISQKGSGKIYITLERNKNEDKKAIVKNKSFHRLIFRDTGIGIAEDKIGLIFDRFYSDKKLGTGIGLTFCKSTIESFGGDLSCISVVGEQTTFIISLPVVDVFDYRDE